MPLRSPCPVLPDRIGCSMPDESVTHAVRTPDGHNVTTPGNALLTATRIASFSILADCANLLEPLPGFHFKAHLFSVECFALRGQRILPTAFT